MIIPILFSTFSSPFSSFTICSTIACSSANIYIMIVHLDICIWYFSDLSRWSISFPRNMFLTFIDLYYPYISSLTLSRSTFLFSINYFILWSSIHTDYSNPYFYSYYWPKSSIILSFSFSFYISIYPPSSSHISWLLFGFYGISTIDIVFPLSLIPLILYFIHYSLNLSFSLTYWTYKLGILITNSHFPLTH